MFWRVDAVVPRRAVIIRANAGHSGQFFDGVKTRYPITAAKCDLTLCGDTTTHIANQTQTAMYDVATPYATFAVAL